MLPEPPDETSDIMQRKAPERRRMQAWRRGPRRARPSCASSPSAVAAHGLGFLQPPETYGRCGSVSGFASLPDEFRLWPLLRSLPAQGYALALPVMRGKGNPLIFRAWAPGDAHGQRVWGIAGAEGRQAGAGARYPAVPLLAFDAAGWRLGYGGGFYDRTLARLRARKPVVAFGIAFDEQRVDAVPHLDYDERLDWVLTPSGPFRCQRQ
jgi:5-formyltetrahydrofolate cyclo-ligase